MEKALYSAEDIAQDLSIPVPEAERLLDGLRKKMERGGQLTVRGFVSRLYYERQKETGFLEEKEGGGGGRIPVNEKRLLNLEEFCEYAGGIGICTARKYVRKLGIEVRIGGRCLVDREKFDRWCDSGNAAGLSEGRASGRKKSSRHAATWQEPER